MKTKTRLAPMLCLLAAPALATEAYGLVAILQNGPGPRLLIRTDMDALPIVEEPGVTYASHVRTNNAAGQDVGVLHACGHDVHVTTMIGTARARRYAGEMARHGHAAMDPVKLAAAQAAGKSLPGPHTNLFEPLPEPTLRTGVKAMTSVAIALLQK
jgi:hypothetical protein